MSKSKVNTLITASVMSAVYLAGVSNVSQAVVFDVTDNKRVNAEVSNQPLSIAAPANSLGQHRYIIQLEGPAVARFDGNAQFAPVEPRLDGKLDVNSVAVQAYRNHLVSQQTQMLNNMSQLLGRNVSAIQSFQFAYNGVAVYLDKSEVQSVKNLSGVKNISLDRDYFVTTDAGPSLIGANNIWGVDGAPNPDIIFSTGFELELEVEGDFGAGVVIGTLDTGANFDHPSFAEVGGDGYVHVNPLGSGNFIGVCDSSNPDQYLANYTCNDKLIGGYDFVHGLEPVDGFDIEGPEDENGHGSHTASTSGGNMLATAEASGVTGIGVSGVAPHATHIIFDVCYNNSLGQGSCPGVSSIASVDQAIAGGLVDVINFSIGGGLSPWTDPVSEAFLNATASGIFVATSAGNSGPGPGTLGHVEPWTASSGASTHDREFFNLLSITSPPGDPSLIGIVYNTSNGPAAGGNINAGIEFAGNIDAGNFEGCNPFAAMSFDGLVALISRGSCSFEDKVNNAFAAGAVAAIIYNNAPGGLNMNVGAAQDIPSFSISQVDGDAMAAYLGANTSQTVEILLPSISYTGQSDVMAGFSSRGPSPYEYNKPDVASPGVNILAAFNDDDPTSTGTPAEYGIISGTSMASPHTAGSAALLKEVRPDWSVHEIKSALMMTAVTTGVTKEDGLTSADPFDRGAGRIQVDIAAQSGLVMDEIAANFAFADPDNGGDPTTLNVANLTDYSCIETCSFQRVFRSVASSTVTYDASVVDIPGTVTPSSFTLNPGQFIQLEVEVDGLAMTPGATTFGELVIAENQDTTFNTAPALAITDNGYDGTTASMDCADINVSGITDPTFTASLELGIDHTWIGDLTVKLINPNGDELAVMNGVSDSSDLLSTSPISFVDGAAVLASDMGDNITGAEVVCQDDGICEYAPDPNGEPEPPSSFADLGVGDPNGTWQICGGDSANGDPGTIETANLTIVGLSEASVPQLHLPMVIIGFPPEPEIEVLPASLSQAQDPDTSNALMINIANLPTAGADLNWSILSDLSLVNYKVFEQPNLNGNDGIVSDYFDDGVTNAGAYSADAMTLSSDSLIEKMYFDGFISNGSSMAANISAMTVAIYSDAGGVPANHPEDGLNGEVYTLTLPLGDPNLDTTTDDGQVEFNILGNDGSSLALPAGTYWVTAYANFTGADRWNWFAGVDVTGNNGQLIDPTDIFNSGFTDWTDLTVINTVFAGLSFNASRELNCGASWLSTDLAMGSNVPGDSTNLTVTINSAGLAPGDYAAAVCINSNDSDEALTIIPVDLTVNDVP